ncbi:MAG: heavy metal translocating P-type ATPase metal-binding domain-containing protein [Flavobacteriaceae bacterium]|nr:heavy metal translocating P-type ATPase metal-binding domain-containing protein [Flavobacteriaceae bacterium]
MNRDYCFHCGDICESTTEKKDDKTFCCTACKMVYQIINGNNLNDYYKLNDKPGVRNKKNTKNYDFLSNKDIVKSLIEFEDDNTVIVNFKIPDIHCSSCIWILENLRKIDKYVINSIVNFPKKTVRVTYNKKEINLKELVVLLSSIGYAPYLSLEDNSPKTKKNNSLVYKIVLAGFAFGNSMFLAFPEYFAGEDDYWLDKYKMFFRIITLVITLPVVFYSANDYFIKAYKGLKNKIINMDIPIALGVSVLFLRSCFEILYLGEQGYLDSLNGLVFYLLLGRLFQYKTYSYLSFERDYKSYFPIGITKIENDKEIGIPVHKIEIGDVLLIRNNELIPADCVLVKGKAILDYSFVSGESVPVNKQINDQIYAGGKQQGDVVEVKVTKSVSQSYLTSLWNSSVFDTKTDKYQSMTDKISKYFTIVVLLVTLFSAIYWYFNDVSNLFNVVTSVLIVACPCALALAAPFSFGNMIRIFGYHDFYLKNTQTIEKLATINHIVFDKTGTITTGSESKVNYSGEKIPEIDRSVIKAIMRTSNHPLGRMLYENMKTVESCKDEFDYIKEYPGKGLEANIYNKKYKVGSFKYVSNDDDKSNVNVLETVVYISIDDKIYGKCTFKNNYRDNIKVIFAKLSEKFKLSILSGDNEGERTNLENMLGTDVSLFFNRDPHQKMDYIKDLQNKSRVMMVGDGLNDSGAIKQSDVGVSISEGTAMFTPASDAILSSKQFDKLPSFIKLSEKTVMIVKISFVLSFMYNIVGLYYAVTAQLSPIFAAILMPVSSISVVIFVTLATYYYSYLFLGREINKREEPS